MTNNFNNHPNMHIVNPFERRQNIAATREEIKRSNIDTTNLGEASNLMDNYEAEQQALQPFIPAAATTEAGMDSISNFLREEVHKQASVFQRPYAPEPVVPNAAHAQIPQAVQPEPAVLNQAPVLPKVEPPKVDVPITTEGDDDKPEFTDEEVLPILDALLTSGCAKINYSIRGIPLTLRTQYFWEDQLVVKAADKMSGPDTNLRVTGAVFYDMFALAANLETFGGAHFPALPQGKPEELTASFEERVEFLKTLPSALISVIMLKRMEFLNKVNFVITNFDRLIKVF